MHRSRQTENGGNTNAAIEQLRVEMQELNQDIESKRRESDLKFKDLQDKASIQ